MRGSGASAICSTVIHESPTTDQQHIQKAQRMPLVPGFVSCTPFEGQEDAGAHPHTSQVGTDRDKFDAKTLRPGPLALSGVQEATGRPRPKPQSSKCHTLDACTSFGSQGIQAEDLMGMVSSKVDRTCCHRSEASDLGDWGPGNFCWESRRPCSWPALDAPEPTWEAKAPSIDHLLVE